MKTFREFLSENEEENIRAFQKANNTTARAQGAARKALDDIRSSHKSEYGLYTFQNRENGNNTDIFHDGTHVATVNNLQNSHIMYTDPKHSHHGTNIIKGMQLHHESMANAVKSF